MRVCLTCSQKLRETKDKTYYCANGCSQYTAKPTGSNFGVIAKGVKEGSVTCIGSGVYRCTPNFFKD